MIKREDIGKSEIKVYVELNGEVWEKHQSKAFDNLKNNLQLKGFRKGKIPNNIAKQNISQDLIWRNAIEKNLKEITEQANKKITEKDNIVAGPLYQVSKITKESVTIIFSYILYPDVNIKNYKNLDIKFLKPEVNKKDVDDELMKIQDRLSIWNIVSDEIKDGFKAKFDFEGFVDGKPFAGGKAENYELIIGSKKFIPGFEENMISLKRGDKKEIDLVFPKKYHDKNMAGKKVKFKVNIHEVYQKSTPEIDDILAKESNIPDVSTLKDLTKFVEKTIYDTRMLSLKNDFKNHAFTLIKKELDINIPESLINQEVQRIVKRFEDDLKRQGTTFNEYKKDNNIDPKLLIEKFTSDAELRLLDSFIYADIALKEKIELSEKEYEDFYAKIAKVYSQDIKTIKESIPKTQLQIQLMNDKVIDLLISNRKK